MTQLTDQQFASAARNAGFTGAGLVTAVAVGLAESGGNTDARNTNTNGSTDSGLWQINSIHSALIAGRNLNDPAINASLAYQLSSRGTNWSPWSAYKNGSYRKFMARAAAATGLPNVDVPGGGAGGASTDPSSGAIGTAFSFLTNTGMWARVGVFLLGGILLLIGLVQVTGATNLIPSGRILKTVKRLT